MSFAKKWDKIKSQGAKSIDRIDTIRLQEKHVAQEKHTNGGNKSMQALLRQAQAYVEKDDNGSKRLILSPPLAAPDKEPERWDAFDVLCANLFKCNFR